MLPWKLTLEQRLRVLGRFQPDIIVMQGVRHDLNRPALYSDWPIVLDMDDADFHLPHLADPVAQAMPQVAGVVAGSCYVADWCRGQGAGADVVWTATAVSRRAHVHHAKRPPVVAWAQTAPANYTAEADWVLELMQRLTRYHPDLRLRLYDRKAGDSPDILRRFQQAGIHTEWLQSTKYSDYLASFDDVAVGLAPLSPTTPFSRGKSFGKVLAYLDRQVPVIGSDVGEYSAFFGPDTGVISNDPAVWVEAASKFLTDPARRQAVSAGAYQAFLKRLTVPAAAQRLDHVLRQYLT